MFLEAETASLFKFIGYVPKVIYSDLWENFKFYASFNDLPFTFFNLAISKLLSKEVEVNIILSFYYQFIGVLDNLILSKPLSTFSESIILYDLFYP